MNAAFIVYLLKQAHTLKQRFLQTRSKSHNKPVKFTLAAKNTACAGPAIHCSAGPIAEAE